MKFTIDSQHREYFRQHLAIEFDDLLASAQLKKLTKALFLVLSERMGLDQEKASKATAEQLFMAGRDLWRAHDTVQKVITQRRLAEFASELTGQKTIRLGFDEFFPDPGPKSVFSKIADPYHKLLNKKIVLSEICCLQGVLCGLMLCLEGDGTKADEQLSAFTRVPGNGVYMGPDFLIDFTELYERLGHKYLLIVYSQSSTVYIHQKEDPHGACHETTGIFIWR